MAVLFGLLIIFAIVACCAAISGRFPRTTAAFTFLLWIMTAIFFILGSGNSKADMLHPPGISTSLLLLLDAHPVTVVTLSKLACALAKVPASLKFNTANQASYFRLLLPHSDRFAGGLNGAFHVAKDSCLYVETFVTNLAVTDSHNSSRVSLALNYYFGQESIAADDVPYQIYGINTDQLYDAVNSPAAQIFLGYLDTPVGQAFVTNTSVLNSTEENEILALPTVLNQINSSIRALTDAVQVEAISPLYHQAKDLVCCQVSDVLHRLWLAWTVTASVAAALAIFLTAKVISSVGPVSRGEYYTEQATDSAAPGKGSIFRRVRHQPGQYQPGRYSSGQFIKSGTDGKPSAPLMSA